eukprot:COSAG06_NODE_8510_length_2145_cov_16.636809_1_plen_571_part_10
MEAMLVGTPLYEEEEGRGGAAFVPTKKVDPLWKQEVVDAEGRRRFHGAFTGGYSAGYYNTVGSAEGWAPKEFKSSRSNRSQQQQSAEDFMDEEDLTSFGGKQLQTNSQYDSLGSTAADLQRQTQREAEASRSIIPGAAPAEFVAPAIEGIGKQLLRLMGWREGQGVGPRRARKRKHAATAGSAAAQKASDDGPQQQPTAKRYYGCPLPPGAPGGSESAKKGEEEQDEDVDVDDDADDDPYGAAFLFAPKNTAAFDPGTGKNNFFGLAFDPYTDAPEFREQQQQQQPSATLGGTQQQQQRGAFGIGALEDEDDHEVYDRTERSEYDFETGGAEGESRRRGRQGAATVSQRPAVSAAAVEADGGKCSDGMPALAGFVVANRSSLPAKWYAAPAVPRDFQPFHTFQPEEGETGATAVTSGNWVVDEKGGWKLEKPKPTEPKNPGGQAGRGRGRGGGKGTNLSAAQRGQALGEAAAPTRPPPGLSAVSAAPPPPRLGVGSSLMSLNNPGMSDADRQKIAATLAAGSRFVKASESGPDAAVADGSGGKGDGSAAAIPAELSACFLPDEPGKQARLE